MNSGVFSRDSQTKTAEHLTVYCPCVCDYSNKIAERKMGSPTTLREAVISCHQKDHLTPVAYINKFK